MKSEITNTFELDLLFILNPSTTILFTIENLLAKTRDSSCADLHTSTP